MRDLNPRPLLPESSALANCANPRNSGQGGTRTRTDCSICTWSIRVYQFHHMPYILSERRGSNPLPSAWEADVLPSELLSLCWWTQEGSNLWPLACEANALTNWAMGPWLWTWGESNPWPPQCECGALPTELQARFCRAAGNRTRATGTPCPRTTIILRPDTYVLYYTIFVLFSIFSYNVYIIIWRIKKRQFFLGLSRAVACT